MALLLNLCTRWAGPRARPGAELKGRLGLFPSGPGLLPLRDPEAGSQWGGWGARQGQLHKQEKELALCTSPLLQTGNSLRWAGYGGPTPRAGVSCACAGTVHPTPDTQADKLGYRERERETGRVKTPRLGFPSCASPSSFVPHVTVRGGSKP